MIPQKIRHQAVLSLMLFITKHEFCLSINHTHPRHFRKLYLNKNQLEFFFSHLFVLSQKVLWPL